MCVSFDLKWMFCRQHMYSFLIKYFIYFIFREKVGEGEKEGDKHQCVVDSHTPLSRDLTHNQSMCPDWELNRRPVFRTALSPLSHTSQGYWSYMLIHLATFCLSFLFFSFLFSFLFFSFLLSFPSLSFPFLFPFLSFYFLLSFLIY